MKKYIFLDMDGVLATPASLDYSATWGITPCCSDFLGHILHETGADIVISSSWRLHTLEDTIKYFKDNQFEHWEKIVGHTIRAYHYLEKGLKIHLSIPRGVEIKQWLDTHVHSNNGKDFNRKKVGKDFNYVILDDDSDMLLEQANHFVKCDSYIGLTEELSEKAIKILNSDGNDLPNNP